MSDDAQALLSRFDVTTSAVDIDDPYRQCDLRGRVVARIDGEEALDIADGLALKYTGAPFPLRSGVVYVVEPERVNYLELPFEH